MANYKTLMPRPAPATSATTSPRVVASTDAVVRAALVLAAKRWARGSTLHAPESTADYLRLRYAALEREMFTVLYLDEQSAVIAVDEFFRSEFEGAAIAPRAVVRNALLHNAPAVILAHCAPASRLEPSTTDELVNILLREALAVVGIRVADQLIVSAGGLTSFAQLGLL